MSLTLVGCFSPLNVVLPMLELARAGHLISNLPRSLVAVAFERNSNERHACSNTVLAKTIAA